MALVAIDPRSGEIAALVGSRDYFAVAQEGNFNVATALRQPGSAFKPFVYATAFAKGLTPETVLFDVPTEFNPACTPDGTPRPEAEVAPEDCYHPQNYDEVFRGPVTVRQAIAQSLNVPSVKVLYLAGVEDSIRTAESLGISSLADRSRFGLSLVLGGAEVRLLEMVGAYGALANDGVLAAPVAVLRVQDASGRVVDEYRPSPRPMIDPAVARTVNDVLSDNEARVPVFQPRSSLYFGDRRVAAKTGTTQDFRDAWTIGYTPSLAAGVWAGNNDNTPMQQKGSGVMAAAPAWHEFMALAMADHPPEEFPPPARRETVKPVLSGVWQGDVVIGIDTISGKRATEFTPPETRRDVAVGTPHDPLHWIDRQNPDGPPPDDPSRDPQYANWEAAFQRWRLSSGFVARDPKTIPPGSDDVHTPEKRPRVFVAVRRIGQSALALTVRVEATYALREIALIAQGRALATLARPGPASEFTIPAGELEPGGPAEVRAYDIVGNIGAAAVPLEGLYGTDGHEEVTE